MKLTFVEIAGFRGFKNKVRFEIPDGFVVLTGPNGVGKSTVLDAIDFALTGTINKYAVREAKGGGLESHIWWVNEGAPTEQYVSVGFADGDGRTLQLKRSRERGLDASMDEIATGLCTSVPYGSDWPTTLIQTSLIRDETIAALSLDLPEQARFAAVRSAMGILGGRDYSNRTTAILSAATSAKDHQSGRVSSTETELGRALTGVTEARSLAERHPDVAQAEKIIQTLAPDLSSASSGRVETLRRLVADRKGVFPKLQEAANNLEALLREQQHLNSDAGKREIDAANAAVEEAKQNRDSAVTELAEATDALETEQKNNEFVSHMLALLDHGEAVGLQSERCPLCAATRTPQEFAAAISSARLRLKEQGERAARAVARSEAAKKRTDDSNLTLLTVQTRAEELQQRKRQIETELRGVIDLFARWKLPSGDPIRAREQLLRWREETAQLEQALLIIEASGSHDRVLSLQTRVNRFRTALDEELAKLSAAERAVEAARQIDTAARTVSNQVLAEQFDTIMPLLKELYTRLRPHADWREIEIDFGGRVRASLNFVVGDGKNPQFLFSSGQRRAAGLAFLLSIHLSRPWCNFHTLLLDDPVQHIDDYRALNLVEVLSAIRRTGRQIIVAVQDSALADVLCRRLRSTATEPGRRFDLHTAVDGAAAIRLETDIFPLPQSTMQIAAAS